jgi:hypothetical protein
MVAAMVVIDWIAAKERFLLGILFVHHMREIGTVWNSTYLSHNSQKQGQVLRFPHEPPCWINGLAWRSMENSARMVQSSRRRNRRGLPTHARQPSIAEVFVPITRGHTSNSITGPVAGGGSAHCGPPADAHGRGTELAGRRTGTCTAEGVRPLAEQSAPYASGPHTLHRPN